MSEGSDSGKGSKERKELSKINKEVESDDSNPSVTSSKEKKHEITNNENVNLTNKDGSREDNRRQRSPSTDNSGYSIQRHVSAFLEHRESEEYQYYPGVERLEYNFEDERKNATNTNIIESIAHFTKGSLGVGVLCMHEAYMYAGIWTSLVSTLAIGFISWYCSYILVDSAQMMYRRVRVAQLSYSDLAEVAAVTGPCMILKRHPKMFRHVLDFWLLFELSGTCCIYQIVVAATLRQVLDLNIHMNDIRLYIVLCIPLLLPLCMIRSLKFLAPFSMLADIFIAVCVITTQYYSVQRVSDISSRPAWKDLHGFTKFFGICLFCLCGTTVALPIENNMKRPKSFSFVLGVSASIVVTSVAITGFFGYWAWGEKCTSPITLHMPRNSFTVTLQILLVIMLSVTFALEFYVPFLVIWHYIEKKTGRHNVLLDRVYRIVYFFFITGVSIAFHNLIPVMNFIGHFCLGIIAIALPAFIEFSVTYHDDRINHIWWRIIKNFILIAFGVICSLSAFYPIFG